MDRKPRTPLTPQDWVKAAFLMLSNHGIASVKAERLAVQLGATKGSFYWHFKDVPALHDAMLMLWRSDATAAIIDEINATSPDGPARLVALTRMIAALNAGNEYGGSQVEPAVRAWALFNEAASQTVQHVDRERLAYVQNLFEACGLSVEVARESAETYYACYIGMQVLAGNNAHDIASRLETLLALQLLKAH